MDEPFALPVTYKGEALQFTTRLLTLGYTHNFQVDVNDMNVIFEPDEERTYRATVDSAILQTGKKVDVELLKAIAEAIEALLK